MGGGPGLNCRTAPDASGRENGLGFGEVFVALDQLVHPLAGDAEQLSYLSNANKVVGHARPVYGCCLTIDKNQA